MQRKERPSQRVRRFVREYTDGLSQEEVRRLFDREAAEAYRVLTRDQTEPEPKDQLKRFLHRCRLVFLGISYKLTPARRALFVVSLLCFLLSLTNLSFDLGAYDGSWSFRLEYSPFWSVIGFGCLLFLLTLELVDKVRVRDELEVARQLQGELLPRGNLELPGYALAHSYRTANEVGGDYYDFQRLSDGRLALVVGDASGHGMAAGLVMAIANATLKTALDIDPACQRVHAVLNRTICRTGDRRTFMSLFYGLLEPSKGRLEYVCAGHPFPLLRRADGAVEELGQGGLPLGLRDPLAARCFTVTLAPGDRLLLYSDGLPEALSTTGAAFGYERLSRLLAAGGSPQQIHDRILAEFDRHTEGEPLKDDLTLMVLERQLPLPPVPAS